MRALPRKLPPAARLQHRAANRLDGLLQLLLSFRPSSESGCYCFGATAEYSPGIGGFPVTGDAPLTGSVASALSRAPVAVRFE